MPVSRARLRYLEEQDAWSELGTPTIEVLTLLATNPHMGYRPTEIIAETGVPEPELSIMLEEFEADGYVETIGDYYLINRDRLEQIRDDLWTARHREAAAPVRRPDTVSTNGNESDEDPGPDIDLSQPAPSPADVFSDED